MVSLWSWENKKTPGDIPPGVFCFPQGKQKTPSAVHIILWFKLWIAPGVFCFPWGKQKTPGGISPGVFCFPRITLKSQCTDFENCFNQVINEISENASSRKLENQNWFSQPLVHTVIGRTRDLRALVLSITVWTRGWENPVPSSQLPGKDTFLSTNKFINSSHFNSWNCKFQSIQYSADSS